jgi:hypothetical protein
MSDYSPNQPRRVFRRGIIAQHVADDACYALARTASETSMQGNREVRFGLKIGLD